MVLSCDECGALTVVGPLRFNGGEPDPVICDTCRDGEARGCQRCGEPTMHDGPECYGCAQREGE